MQKFQDLEEERIDFTKSSLWSYANIASTVCVTDDASCEKIRLSLESCEVEKDIMGFIRERGTGQEIPDPPRYINFARGDVNDTQSEASEDDNSYSVAQFQRTINPAFRSASPNPSTYESHHDPQSELAIRMKHGGSDVSGSGVAPANNQPSPLDVRRGQPQQPSKTYDPNQHGDIAQVPHNEYPADGMTMFCRTGPPSTTGSGLTSQTRPSSRDSGSDYSNPTSFSSHDPVSGKSSPTKHAPINGVEMPGMSPDKGLQKKRSGFFSNSPFRRKSQKGKSDSMSTPQNNRNTWASASSRGPGSQTSSPTKYGRPPLFSRDTNGSAGDEPVDPRASFQLNVGNNVFDVASPDSNTTPKANKKAPGPQEELDPIAQALADLKGNVGKQSSVRVSADRYHGIATPAPGMDRPAPLSATSSDRLAAQRGTPPPAYDPKAAGLGVPQPAFTSKEMRARTAQYGNKMDDVYGRGSGGQPSRPGTRDGTIPRATSPSPMHQNMRSRSPGPGMMNGQPPQMRARSPGPGMNDQMRARSPGPGMMHDQMRARSPGPGMMNSQPQAQYRAASPNPYGGGNGGGRPRGQSTSPQKRGSDQGYSSYQQNSRHNSPQTGMEVQLSQGGRPGYGSNDSGRGRTGAVRPQSSYGGDPYSHPQGGAPRGNVDPQQRRERSKSMAAPGGGGFTRDGRQILHYGKPSFFALSFLRGPKSFTNAVMLTARAMYSYTAAIPEELSFMKNDVLGVLRLQDDGWWEAELQGKGRGLVPSNYLVRC